MNPPAKKTSPKKYSRVSRKTNPTITLTGMPIQAQETWWSQRFISVLESFKLGGRLARGKAYADEAKVLKVNISSGLVTSAVQGSRKASYKINVRLAPLSDYAWKQVLHNLTKKAIHAAEMLQDRMPTDVETVFAEANVSLFPEKLENLRSECDCPDWSNPCKHIAATYYVLAKHFDLDPFLIFAWRGRLKTQILDALRQHWKQGKGKPGMTWLVGRDQMDAEDLQRFWIGALDANVQSALDPFSRAVADAAIKKLGPSPLRLGDRDLGSFLADCYNKTSEAVRDWSHVSRDQVVGSTGHAKSDEARTVAGVKTSPEMCGG